MKKLLLTCLIILFCAHALAQPTQEQKTPPGGGGGTPGGSNGQIQFNNAGAFGGISTVPNANGGVPAGSSSQVPVYIGSGAVTAQAQITSTAVTEQVVATGTSITPTAGANGADLVTQINTGAAGTLTINAPTGTAIDGETLLLRLQTTNVQTLSWNATYFANPNLTLPTSSSGSSLYDYFSFRFNSTRNSWDLIGLNQGAALGPLVTNNGGTGLATLTAHAVLLGEGTSPVGNVPVMAADTVLQGQGASTDPAAATLPSCSTTSNAVTYNTTTHAFGCNTISGSGTVNSGTGGQNAYYAATGTAVSGNPNETISGGALTLGVAGTTLGQLNVAGNTSGTVSLIPQAAAGTWNFNLPITAGTSGQVLTSGGGGSNVMTWTTNGSGTVNTGTSGQMAYYASTGTAVSGTANATINSGALTLGVANTTLGDVILEGNTSGAITIQPQAAAGTYNFNLPTTAGSAGQVLTSQAGGSTAMTWTTPSSGTPTDVQVFTAAGGSTWTKPSGSPKTTKVILCGGGGAGGSGGFTAALAAFSGGGAGGAGGYMEATFPTSILGATETVTVGTGGTGGAGVGSGNGAGGTAGTSTTFGSWLTAYGGGFGAGGRSASNAGGGGGAGFCALGGNASGSTNGGAGNCGGTAGGGGAAQSASDQFSGGSGGLGNQNLAGNGGAAWAGLGGGGGGGGGGLSTSAAFAGGTSGLNFVVPAGNAGGALGTVGGNGTSSAATSEYMCGGGGGGGGAGSAGNGGAGGNGVQGGAGGGGGSTVGGTSGAGGNGGNGFAAVITSF